MTALDKYARDAHSWRDFAKMNHVAAQRLFPSGNPAIYLVAATLGHHALELYLKAALINDGMTVFNPGELQSLDAGIGLVRETVSRLEKATFAFPCGNGIGYLTADLYDGSSPPLVKLP